MNLEYEIKVPDASFLDATHKVAGWTVGEHMLPKKPEDIYGLFNSSRSVLVYNPGDTHEPLAHAAITAIYPDKKVEIGAIVVHPDHRREGLGSLVTLGVLQLAEVFYSGYGVIALANPVSSKLFAKLGAREMSSLEVCSEVWEFCQNCPKLPKQVPNSPFKCCDKLYDLEPLKHIEEAVMYLGNVCVLSWLSNYIWRKHVAGLTSHR